jgi:hypothetical protein
MSRRTPPGSGNRDSGGGGDTGGGNGNGNGGNGNGGNGNGGNGNGGNGNGGNGNGGNGGGGKGPGVPPAVEGPLQHAIPALKKPTPHGQGGQPPGRARPTGRPAGGQWPGGAGSMDTVTPGWRRVDAQDVPQHVRDDARGFEPRVSGDPGRTTAVYDGQTLTSGGGQRQLADDIAYERIPREGGRPYPQPPNILYEHPEMRIAADMRDRKLLGVEVVVDNSLCGTRGFDSDFPLTCDKLLPQVMPNGSQMTVWATTDGGKTFFNRVITGTGSLIRP